MNNGNQLKRNVPVTLVFPPGLHQEIKVFAAEKGKKISDIYIEAVRQYLANQGANHDHKCNHA